MPDDTMANLIPQGLAAIYDPDPACVLGAVIWVSSAAELA